ncbi:hypothetical protein [Clostridium sp. Marseille-Q7071]
MPEKLQPIEKPNFSSLAPAQVRISSTVEIGTKYLGRSDELVDLFAGSSCQRCESCVTCQRCQTCQSCQRNPYRMSFEGDIDIDSLSAGPVKIAKDVIYELIQEADMEHGECQFTQSRTILEMPQEAYEQMPEKDRLVEIGTTDTGTKQYLLRGASPKKIK